MTRRTVDHLLYRMKEVAREATDPWVRKFAEDMVEKSTWRNWNPSQKQRAMMDKLVNELFSHADLEVFEE